MKLIISWVDIGVVRFMKLQIVSTRKSQVYANLSFLAKYKQLECLSIDFKLPPSLCSTTMDPLEPSSIKHLRTNFVIFGSGGFHDLAEHHESFKTFFSNVREFTLNIDDTPDVTTLQRASYGIYLDRVRVFRIAGRFGRDCRDLEALRTRLRHLFQNIARCKPCGAAKLVIDLHEPEDGEWSGPVLLVNSLVLTQACFED